MSKYFDSGADRENFSIVMSEVHPDAGIDSEMLISEAECKMVSELCDEKQVEYYEEILDLCHDCFDVDPNNQKITMNNNAKTWQKSV